MVQTQDGFPAVMAADTEHCNKMGLLLRHIAPCFLFKALPPPYLNIAGEEQ